MRTARVFARSATGAEAMWCPEERRVLIAKPAAEGGWWVLLTVLYPPARALRAGHLPGTRAAAFWRLMDKQKSHTGG